jgi:hypothetical protein
MKTIFANSTRGGKYTIHLLITGGDDVFPGTYEIKEFTNGSLTGFANLGQCGAQVAVAKYNQMIDDAAKYDGIHYTKDLKALLSEEI